MVGLDIDFEGTKDWIVDLRVIGDEGYAYLLAPGDEGQLAISEGIDNYDEDFSVYDLETGLTDGEEKESFTALVARMSAECEGAEEYEKGGAKWILAWAHETASSGDGTDCGSGGFITAVTVAEDVLLKVGGEERTRESWVTVALLHCAW